MREMLLSVYGTSVVGDDGGGGATVWRDTSTCWPGGSCCSSRSGRTDAYFDADTATPATTSRSNRAAIKRQQLQ